MMFHDEAVTVDQITTPGAPSAVADHRRIVRSRGRIAPYMDLRDPCFAETSPPVGRNVVVDKLYQERRCISEAEAAVVSWRQ